MRVVISEVVLLRGNMAPRMLAKLNRSDHVRSWTAVEDSPSFEGFADSKSMEDQFSVECVRGRGRDESMLLGRANQEFCCAAAAAGPDAKRVLADWSPPISRLLSAMRSVPKDDDRRMPVVAGAGVKGGFLVPLCGAVGGFRFAAPNDCAFSKAVVPRAARLNDCEFRDNVPRALVSESSREIAPPTGAVLAAVSLASRSGAVGCNSMSMSLLSEDSITVAGTAGSRAANGSPPGL